MEHRATQMNTQTIAQHLQVEATKIKEVRDFKCWNGGEVWLVLFVKGRSRFVSKKVVKPMKLSLEEAAKIVNDPEAIKRNYLNQDVLNQAIAMAQELKEAGFSARDGMCVFPNTASITDKYQDSMKCRQFATCEEIAVVLLFK
jgi:hypothetical protein